MKLKKKLKYIILPVIMIISSLVTFAYYNVYKQQIIKNKITLLDMQLENLLLQAEHQLINSKTYLKQKIDSKEAALIFNRIEQGEQLPAQFVTQFFNSFVDSENSSDKVVNDFVIYNHNSELIVHINTQDPFAGPVLRQQTQTILDRLNRENKKLAQFYYFLGNTQDNAFPPFYLIRVFSRYQLSSKSFYYKNDDIYLIQAELNLNLIKNEMRQLIAQHQGYLQYKLIRKQSISDSLLLTRAPFSLNDEGVYQGKLQSAPFDITFTLDKSYFNESLNYFLRKYLLLSLFLMLITYFILSAIIEKQIITPITALAKRIKYIDVSPTVELKRLQSRDEVSDLNDSYINFVNKINALANNDKLTGLANRGSFSERLTQLKKAPQKNTGYIALFFIDLDNFKYVNDTFGHHTGDHLLVVFSQRLKKVLRAKVRLNDSSTINSIARLGGDEFVVLIDGLPSLQAIESIGQRICDLFKDGFSIATEHYDVHASIGIAYSHSAEGSFNEEELLNKADSAMYMAKKDGKNNFKLFSSALEEKLRREKQIEYALKEAKKRNELFLVFLPAYTTSPFALRGYEVLVRCPALAKMGIGPDVFIPIAEKMDLILDIDLWVVENAFMKQAELVHKSAFTGIFAINVSPKSLRDKDFYPFFKKLLDKYALAATQISIDITETCLLANDKRAIATLHQLKALGIQIALDDFGAGYTSIRQLVDYPLDTLKIARSFVKDRQLTPVAEKPALDIIFELGKVYQLDVIITGIETEADLEHAQRLGCNILQGYYFSKPRAWEEVLNGTCLPPLENVS